ncbi:CotH kinase family protein [Paenibacillus sp. Z6-24]
MLNKHFSRLRPFREDRADHRRAGRCRSVFLLLAAVLPVTLSGCSVPQGLLPWDVNPATSVQQEAYASDTLSDNKSLYQEETSSGITDIYITIMHQNLDRNHPLSWDQLSEVSSAEDENNRSMDAIFQEGNAEGPVHGMFGYSDYQANSSISLRGNDSLRSAQKSYKIKLNGQAGAWRDQSTVNLVKSVNDLTRFRNRLSFDYMTRLPDTVSMQTSFVRLHIKDLTREDAQSDEFADYGLYTQIEQPNKKFLRAHGLDSSGGLYKANNFKFDRNADALKLEDDPTFDKDRFQDTLQVKGSKDHQKLLQMLDDVNASTTAQFDDVFDRYFDRDNVLSWLAVNILMDNYSTSSENYLLYSPTESRKWFFIPWDYDSAWGKGQLHSAVLSQRAPWQHGIANYWDNQLIRRYFQNPEHVRLLTAKIEEFRKIITPAQTAQMIADYRRIADAAVLQSSDPGYLPGSISDREQELKQLPAWSEQSYTRYLESLQRPMPFRLLEPQTVQGQLQFSWEPSYDLQGETLNYHIIVSRTPDMTAPLLDEQVGINTTAAMKALSSGQYYWTVTAEDPSGHHMTAYDEYTDIDGLTHFGVKALYIP